MIELREWNYKTRVYDPFNSPAKHICFVTDDMDEETDCANCGNTLAYGDTYTSMTIHTPAGLGFPVCSNCYDAELKERLEYER